MTDPRPPSPDYEGYTAAEWKGYADQWATDHAKWRKRAERAEAELATAKATVLKAINELNRSGHDPECHDNAGSCPLCKVVNELRAEAAYAKSKEQPKGEPK
jgi:hypothetical protein